MTAAPQSPTTVLFDLDGTLSDSAPGILAALRHAFAVNGIPQPDPRTERFLLGPPFYESLPPLIGGEERLPAVIAAYRERYGNGGMFDTTVFDGVRDVLVAARLRGVRMAVATSKPEAYAVPIVEHLGLAEFFTTIGGDDLAGSLRTKALVIETVLARLGADPREVVMVGDRAHDVQGAREHGIDCIGVRWGYSTGDELEQAGAAVICETPRELMSALGLAGVVAGEGGHDAAAP